MDRTSGWIWSLGYLFSLREQGYRVIGTYCLIFDSPKLISRCFGGKPGSRYDSS